MEIPRGDEWRVAFLFCSARRPLGLADSIPGFRYASPRATKMSLLRSFNSQVQPLLDQQPCELRRFCLVNSMVAKNRKSSGALTARSAIAESAALLIEQIQLCKLNNSIKQKVLQSFNGQE
jgi:hypothetical protein